MNKAIKVVVPLLAMALFGGLAGTASAKRVTVKLWHIWGGNRGPTFAEAVARFERENPDIKVESSFIGEPTAVAEKVLSAVIAGAAPDVLMTNIDFFGKLAGGGVLEPLDKYMTSDKVKRSDWYPGVIGTAIWNNAVYGMPAVTNGPGIIYRHKQIFREVGLDPSRGPETWDELVEFSKKVTVRQGKTLKRVGWAPFNIAGYFWVKLNGNGTKTVNSDGTKVAFDGESGLETAQWFVDFAVKVYNSQYIWGGSYQDSGIIKGTHPLDEMGVYLIPQLSEYAPKLDYGISGTPLGPRGLVDEIRGGGWAYSVTKSSKNKLAAWKLAKYLGWGDGQYYFTLNQQRPSVIRRLNENPEYAKRTPFWSAIMKLVERDFGPAAKPFPAGWSEIVDIVSLNMGKAMAQQMSARDAIARSAAESNKVLARYQRKK